MLFDFHQAVVKDTLHQKLNVSVLFMLKSRRLILEQRAGLLVSSFANRMGIQNNTYYYKQLLTVNRSTMLYEI